MSITIKHREGTQDRSIIDEVLFGNQYRLPPSFEANDVVIDVGAHIGVFALACLHRGASHVLSVEPDNENCRFWRENLKLWPAKSTLIHGGVQDPGRGSRLTYRRPKPHATCCGNVLGEVGYSVPLIQLDHLIERARKLAGYGRVLLKIDCEGSEYPAIYTAQKLGDVDAICGETHALSVEAWLKAADGQEWPMDHAGMVCYLADKGYAVRTAPCSPSLPGCNVLFWGRKPFVYLFDAIHPAPSSSASVAGSLADGSK